jgi:hypothetical protein
MIDALGDLLSKSSPQRGATGARESGSHETSGGPPGAPAKLLIR